MWCCPGSQNAADDVYEIEAQDQEPSIVEHGASSLGGFLSLTVDLVQSERKAESLQ